MNHTNPPIQLKKPIPFVLIALAFLHFGLLPKAQAVDPPPDGGYRGGNTAEGFNALFRLSGGAHDTAVGDSALRDNTVGDNNTATGYHTLLENRSNQNTATGALALRNNVFGKENTATGFQALLINTDGIRNTATGESALERNSTGNNNTATGLSALHDNTTGGNNTATGLSALRDNTTGGNNTATGSSALHSNTTGSFNTAIGFNTLLNNTTGSNNTAIGLRAGLNSTTGENNIYIGAQMFGVPGESNHTYVRNLNITSVSGGGADTVTVDLGTGLIGHLSSSRRYKEDIKPMDKASESLYRLKPVTYRYKKEIDKTQSLAFGLVAEEVAEVNPGLVAHNAQEQPESVHYEMVNAMLLNEFLKEHKAFVEEQRKVQEQEATIAELKKDLQATAAQHQKQIDTLNAGLQKVSAQLEVGKAAPQTVLNDQ